MRPGILTSSALSLIMVMTFTGLPLTVGARDLDFVHGKCVEFGFKAGTPGHDDCVKQYVASAGGGSLGKPASNQEASTDVRSEINTANADSNPPVHAATALTWGGQISAMIRDATTYAPLGTRNSEARFRIRLSGPSTPAEGGAGDCRITEVQLTRSSGEPAWDRAAEQAIRKSSPWPRPPEGICPADAIEISHRPRPSAHPGANFNIVTGRYSQIIISGPSEWGGGIEITELGLPMAGATHEAHFNGYFSKGGTTNVCDFKGFLTPIHDNMFLLKGTETGEVNFDLVLIFDNNELIIQAAEDVKGCGRHAEYSVPGRYKKE